MYLLAEEEATRTALGPEGYFALRPMLPELAEPPATPALLGKYSSDGALMSKAELAEFLEQKMPEAIDQSYLET